MTDPEMADQITSARSRPTVSIVVPVYNSGDYLRQCLDSLKSQTLEGVEVIVVDDASTDDSADILRTHYHNLANFTILTQAANKGVSTARNLAIAHASGRYIGFIDSDDWAAPEMFERLYNAALSTSAPVVCGGYTKVHADGTPNGTYVFPIPTGTYSSEEILNRLSNPSSHSMLWFCWRNLYCSELVKQVSFHEELRFGEDSVFNLRAFASATHITVTERCDYYYRDTPMSLSSPAAKPEMLNDLTAHFNAKMEAFRERNYPRPVLDGWYDYVVESWLPLLVRNANSIGAGDHSAARREILQVAKADFVRQCLARVKWFRKGRTRGQELVVVLAKLGLMNALIRLIHTRVG